MAKTVDSIVRRVWGRTAEAKFTVCSASATAGQERAWIGSVVKRDPKQNSACFVLATVVFRPDDQP